MLIGLRADDGCQQPRLRDILATLASATTCSATGYAADRKAVTAALVAYPPLDELPH